jgi:uncharacterized protein (DUF736 family)
MAVDDGNSCVLFVNKRKKEGSAQPDYNGHGQVHGQAVEIAGWKRKSQKTGEGFLSLSFQEPRGQNGSQRQQQQQQQPPKDDIDF